MLDFGHTYTYMVCVCDYVYHGYEYMYEREGKRERRVVWNCRLEGDVKGFLKKEVRMQRSLSVMVPVVVLCLGCSYGTDICLHFLTPHPDY